MFLTQSAQTPTQGEYRSVRLNAYGYKCSYNPTYTVGYPWQVSVSVTPDCGRKNAAYLMDSQKKARRANVFGIMSDVKGLKWDQQRKTRVHPTMDQNLSLCSAVASRVVLRDTEGAVRDKSVVDISMSDVCITHTF